MTTQADNNLAIAGKETAGHTPGPWELKLVNEWPFGVQVFGSDGNCVLSQSAVANSSEQRTREDCKRGVGFDIVSKNPDFSRASAVKAIATQDANARLIAAAPETAAERDRLKEINAELLKALHTALEHSNCAGAELSSLVWQGDTTHAVRDAERAERELRLLNESARAAIAKATGSNV